jgi:hypothetical protein
VPRLVGRDVFLGNGDTHLARLSGAPGQRIDWIKFADEVRGLSLRDWLRPSVMLPAM